MPSLSDHFFDVLHQSSNYHSSWPWLHPLIVLTLAFLGGVTSSLLPCTVGMLPILIGYIGGYTANSRLAVLFQTVLFILGFALVLTTLGILAGILGTAMAALIGQNWFYALGGLAILMGFQVLGWIQIPLPQWVTKLPSGKKAGIFAPLLVGAAFGAASSPCGTPFLTAILGFISQEHSWVLGGVALFAYALGQSTLLLLTGLFTGLLKQMASFRRVGTFMTRLSGIVFILAGCLMIAQAAGWVLR